MDTKNECDMREMIATTRPLLDEHIHDSADLAAALAAQDSETEVVQ